MRPTAAHSAVWPRILSEDLREPREPLTLLLNCGAEADPVLVARRAARAVLGSSSGGRENLPWLSPHEQPAVTRLREIIAAYGGALLADAVGLGKSYVALAVALSSPDPFVLVVPAVLAPQWANLLAEMRARAGAIITHESLSTRHAAAFPSGPCRLCIVDEAHRFRNSKTNRYQALAKAVVGVPVLLVTATPVHNGLGDLLHLFKLFLRDDALAPLGIGSLADPSGVPRELLQAAIARLTVARSRTRVRTGYAAGPRQHLQFPERAVGQVVRAGPIAEAEMETLVSGVGRLDVQEAGSLFRLMLLSRLASSMPAFAATLRRYLTCLEQTGRAASEGRLLTRREFRRLFPEASMDALQLALFPVLLPAGGRVDCFEAGARAAELLQVVTQFRALPDPKLRLLTELVESQECKTIVFTNSRETARYLSGGLAHRRAAAVSGEGGLFGRARARRLEVLRAFAPAAQHARTPPPWLETDLLIATDLLSEGLNLQDAARVIHYDVPWTPARLAQRVGRIDRLGSQHPRIETITFVPPSVLALALALEERLAFKKRMQILAGAAQVESMRGADRVDGFDWCDRLHELAGGSSSTAERTGPVWACVRGKCNAAVLVVKVGSLVEMLVIDEVGVHADPARATGLLEQACTGECLSAQRAALDAALERAAPLLRARLETIARARWRTVDRDHVGRRLVPLILADARRAARRGDAKALERLDVTAGRLCRGMTAGEELLLHDLVQRPDSLTAPDLVEWQDRLPPYERTDVPPAAALVAALLVVSR
ncbi:MAG TPA: DEAD/DEAH box helicase [Gemmatimonadales bacterium]|nr:DEAD/DEAH box helicase [Gemmatimonadales bacterium]